MYQSYFNGSKIVQRKVSKGKSVLPHNDSAAAFQMGGAAAVELKKPSIPKVEDKKADRLKMAQEVMRNL